jgi:hypothetical protein
MHLLSPRTRVHILGKIHPHEPEFTGHALIDDKLSKASATALKCGKNLLFSAAMGALCSIRAGILCLDPKDKVVLMDAAGMALLTMRRSRFPFRIVKSLQRLEEE